MIAPGGRVHHPLLPVAGGFRYDDVAHGPTICFRFAPLGIATQVAGRVRVNLCASCKNGFLLVGWLFVETREGERYPVTSGARCVDRSSRPFDVTFEFSDVAALLPKSSRLIAMFATSSWPEFYSPPPPNEAVVLHKSDGTLIELPVFTE